VPGVADGTRLSIDFLHFPAFAKYGELVRQQLGTVGISVTLRPLEPAVFAPTVFKDRNFDSNVISYCNGPDPEIGVRRMYHSSQIGPAPFTNAAAYRNPRVDALFDDASRTVEREKRSRLYRQIQEIVVQDVPYYWLVETVNTRAWTARCSGFRAWTGLFAEGAFCRR
jgi:peptide/nickel transport system substrate-binding protein